jgi:hypothetical protein
MIFLPFQEVIFKKIWKKKLKCVFCVYLEDDSPTKQQKNLISLSKAPNIDNIERNYSKSKK